MPRNVLACLLSAAILVAFAPLASGQDAPPEATPEQTEAIKLFQEGRAFEGEKKFDEAIAKYEAAFEKFADPQLQLAIGNAYQLKGNENRDFAAYQKALDAYKKYLELSPEGPEELTATTNERISVLETAIAEEEEAKKKQAEEEKQVKIAEAKAKREEEERLKKEKEELEGMRPAVDALVVVGLDSDMTLAARLIAGGFLGWKYFGIEGHLAFEGMFPLKEDAGVSGRSLTVLDLGFRVGNGAKNYTGVFASAGAGFGLFGGQPREREIKDNEEICREAPSCSFEIDKNITGRFGLGYGFAASGETTVAARLDFTYWLYSINGEQEPPNVPASRVTKPQQGFSLLLGLEFMRWF